MINTTKAEMILFMVSALCSYLDKSWLEGRFGH